MGGISVLPLPYLVGRLREHRCGAEASNQTGGGEDSNDARAEHDLAPRGKKKNPNRRFFVAAGCMSGRMVMRRRVFADCENDS